MTRKWYAMPQDAVEKELGSGGGGLSSKAASTRRRREGENCCFALPYTSAQTCAAYVCSDISMLLLVVTAVIAAIWGEQGGAILALVALNCTAAIFTYIKARRIVESMAVCTMPRVRVLRGGRVYAIDARLLVRGDVILLQAGDVISCDARLIASDGLDVLEYRGKIDGVPRRGRVTKDASRTYEEREVLSLGEQLNMVFAGSVVLGGQGRAIVVETGADTFLVSTEGQIPLTRQRDRLDVLEALKRFCARSSLLMLVMILPLTLIGVLFPTQGFDLLDYFLLALSLAVSSMSELTAAIGCIVVASGLLYAAKGGGTDENTAIMPHMGDLPHLARMDAVVLFDDLPLTEGKLRVTASCVGTEPFSAAADPAWQTDLLESALIAAGLPHPDQLGERTEGGDDVSALLAFAESCGVSAEKVRNQTKLLGYAAASAANPFDTALIEEQRSPYVICRGEVSRLLPRCRRSLDRNAVGGTCLLRAERRDALLAACAAETESGGYAIAYARRSSPYNTLHRLSAVQDELILIGVLIFRDPIAAGTADAVTALAKAGVCTVLMADAPTNGGDITALARAAGILREGVVCRAPEPIRDDAELCIGYSVAERRAWLTAQKEAGRLMLGVGTSVGDLSLMQACAVDAVSTPVVYNRRRENRILTSLDPANGEVYGAELLKKNASLLIRRASGKSGGLPAIAAARRAARRIEANLASALRCLLAAQGMRCVMLPAILCLRIPVLRPIQILFSGLIVDFAAILACAFDRGPDFPVDRDFFRRPLRSCLPDFVIGAVCGMGSVVTLSILRFFRSFADDVDAGSASFLFLTMLLTQLVLFFVCRRGGAVFRGTRIGLLFPLLLLTFGLICYFSPVWGGVFGVCPLAPEVLLCLLISPMTALFGGEIVRTVSAVRGLHREDADA